jgi:hypothetical protein
LDNVLCLCASCHFYFHKNPLFFADWLRNYLGKDKYELLAESRLQIYKPTIEDLEIKLDILREMTQSNLR